MNRVAGAVAVFLLGSAGMATGAGAVAQFLPVVSGLDNPDFVTNARDGSNRLFLVEQPGVIRVLPPGGGAPTVFLDIRNRVLFGGERGLLGLTFHPQFASNGRFFVDYTRRPDGATVIAEYRVSADPNVASPAETVLLVIPQPFENHNGGMVEFGHDGFLYIAMGDGGSGNDPGNRAQNVDDLLGKILRIDVDHPSSGLLYSPPPDNPFVSAADGRPEIYAYGLRNPFRFSFDRANGLLFAGDVGQGAVEEIDIITKGGNYGWRIWEGTSCTRNDPGLCTTAGFVFPIAEYDHSGGRCAVIGGYVYRGAAATLPQGSYVYGDLCTGEIFLLFPNGASTIIADAGSGITSFGEDESGEIYVVRQGGSVARLVNACAPGSTGDPLCGSLRLGAIVNQTAFAPGDTLFATTVLDNPGGLPDSADVYLGVIAPGGDVVTFTGSGSLATGRTNDLSTLAASLSGRSLLTPFSSTNAAFLSYRWTGTEPRGQYTLFVLAVRAGAFADGVLQPDEIIGLATAPFSF